MFGLDAVKNMFSSVGSYKNFIIIFILTIIFIVAAIYTYRRYVSPKMNPKFVANSEFLPEEANNKPSEVAELYFFYTEWCPHCKKSMPIWQSLKSDLDNKEFKGVVLNFIEVDCDKDTALAEKFNVQGYPTIKLVKGNQVIEYDAKPSKDTLMEFLQTSL
uniref:Thioredoxin domain-containing protein n=1 Tax=viral metagenome TaxID=1070528 RepID=A0A6C0IHY8_9ZZZZ